MKAKKDELHDKRSKYIISLYKISTSTQNLLDKYVISEASWNLAFYFLFVQDVRGQDIYLKLTETKPLHIRPQEPMTVSNKQ